MQFLLFLLFFFFAGPVRVLYAELINTGIITMFFTGIYVHRRLVDPLSIVLFQLKHQSTVPPTQLTHSVAWLNGSAGLVSFRLHCLFWPLPFVLW